MSGITPIACPICSKVFPNAESIDNHLDFCLITEVDNKPPEPIINANIQNNNNSSEKQPNETWSEYYSRRGKVYSTLLPSNPSPAVPIKPRVANNNYYVNYEAINNQKNEEEEEWDKEFSETVQCPYNANCGEINIEKFVTHALYEHSLCDQNIICPLCEMYSPGLYLQQNPTLPPLNEHLYLIHSSIPQADDEEEVWEDIPDEWLKSGSGEFEIPKIHFNNLQITEYSLTEITASGLAGVECQICVEEFLANQSVIRMECFCVFHSHCARQWFSKQSGKNVCPIHREDTSTM